MSEVKTEVYEAVTEKPREFMAYRVRDFHDDPTVSILFEAERCAKLPGVKTAAVEFDWSGRPLLVVTISDGEQARMSMGGWLVIRPKDMPVHPFDVGLAQGMDVSGRIMTYSDFDFNMRYRVQEVLSGV